MKIIHKFTIQEVGNLKVAVTPEYDGIIRLSESGAFIFSLLAEETTEAEILDSLCNRYEAPRETLQQDLKEILAQCRAAGLLDE